MKKVLRETQTLRACWMK